MEKGERLQRVCGHWIVAGDFGIQDDWAKGMAKRSCVECQRRLQDAAPQLLEALEILVHERNRLDDETSVWTLDPSFEIAQNAIDLAVGDRDPVQ